MSKINNWALRKMAALQTYKREEEEGQGLVEYGLIIALVGVVVAAALITLQGKLTTLFNGISFASGS